MIGTRELDRKDETAHINIMGNSEAAFQAGNQILARALARGDRAIVVAPHRTYVEHHYNRERGDAIADPSRQDFPVEDWIKKGAAIKNGGQGGALFVSYEDANSVESLSGISTWTDRAMKAAVEQKGDQRLLFMIDHLESLPAMRGFPRALPDMGKVGGYVVFGVRSTDALEKRYGIQKTNEILSRSRTTLIVSGDGLHQDTAEWASQTMSTGGSYIVDPKDFSTRQKSRTRGRPASKLRLADKTSRPAASIDPFKTIDIPEIQNSISSDEILALQPAEGYLRRATWPRFWKKVELPGLLSKETVAALSRMTRLAAMQTWQDRFVQPKGNDARQVSTHAQQNGFSEGAEHS